MAELEVEAVERIEDDPPEVSAPEYVLYGGKGGVGKTTMAAATALASARDGTATLVVSTDPAHSLSDAFETEVPSEPARVREDAPLWGVEIDPDHALAETRLFDDDGGFGPAGGLDELLGDDVADPSVGGAMPGADEAAAMHQLLRFLDDPRFDRVVVDTAPTGHTLRLLELPELMDTMVGRLVRLRERVSGLLDGVPGVGDDAADDAAGLDELRDRVERLRAVLRDPARTDFRVVLVPEGMSVRESERLVARLDEFGMPVGTVVVNRVMEELASVTGGDVAFVSPDLDDCAFCQRRWEVQRRALAEAQDLFRGHDVRRVPLLADEVRGDAALAVVAAALTA